MNVHTLVAVAVGLAFGLLMVWKVRVRWPRVYKWTLVACCGVSAVVIALGFGDRGDSVWPVLFGIAVLSGHR